MGASGEEAHGDIVVCDVGALVDPDAATVGVLARMQLVARRVGTELHLTNPPPRLNELIGLFGLGEVLPPCSALPIETGRQAEQREEARAVEEERQAGDLSV